MKKISKIAVALLAVAGLSQAALAATPGTYAGLGLGYGRQDSVDYTKQVHERNIPGLTASQQKGNVAGRVFAGYNFNQNFGVEGGYNYLGQQKVNLTSTQITPKVDTQITNSLQSVDLVGKAYLPLSDTGLNLYALGGGAYVHSKVDVSPADGLTLDKDHNGSNALRPKYGVGVSFDVPNSPITTALEVSRVQGEGSKSDIPNVDTAMLTVSYNFG